MKVAITATITSRPGLAPDVPIEPIMRRPRVSLADAIQTVWYADWGARWESGPSS
jgi:hypothetical protein